MKNIITVIIFIFIVGLSACNNSSNPINTIESPNNLSLKITDFNDNIILDTTCNCDLVKKSLGRMEINHFQIHFESFTQQFNYSALTIQSQNFNDIKIIGKHSKVTPRFTSDIILYLLPEDSVVVQMEFYN